MINKMIKMARARGMHVIPGAEMFVQQGARQFETDLVRGPEAESEGIRHMNHM